MVTNYPQINLTPRFGGVIINPEPFKLVTRNKIWVIGSSVGTKAHAHTLQFLLRGVHAPFAFL